MLRKREITKQYETTNYSEGRKEKNQKRSRLDKKKQKQKISHIVIFAIIAKILYDRENSLS